MHPMARARKVTPGDFCCSRSSISNDQRSWGRFIFGENWVDTFQSARNQRIQIYRIIVRHRIAPIQAMFSARLRQSSCGRIGKLGDSGISWSWTKR